MNRDFWQARWDEGRIGFHQEEVNPYLQRFWPDMEVPSGTTVFVPLCGKSQDMVWLSDQGYTVIGVEIVPRAVESFFAENGMLATHNAHGVFTLWESERIKILQGDFFDLTADDVAGIGVIYDRASLIALPPVLRQRYTTHLRNILPSKINGLLITLDYVQAEMNGPPFAVTEEEVKSLYQENYNLEQLCCEDILAANSRFQEQGLSRLQEKVYLLRAR